MPINKTAAPIIYKSVIFAAKPITPNKIDKIIKPRAIINGLCKNFALNTDDCNGNISTVFGYCSITRKLNVAYNRYQNNGKLCDESGNAQADNLFECAKPWNKTAFDEAKCFGMHKIPNRHQKSDRLTDNCCKCRTGHAHLESKNEYGI